MGGLLAAEHRHAYRPAITRGGTAMKSIMTIWYTFIENDTVPNVLLDYTIQYGAVDSSTYIYDNPETVRYYWIDDRRRGRNCPNNTIDFAPWHDTSGSQDEPNSGDFIYIGGMALLGRPQPYSGDVL